LARKQHRIIRSSGVGRRVYPNTVGLRSKLSLRRTADQVALHIERIVNGRVDGNKALAALSRCQRKKAKNPISL
jgi:hypothetical protein